jgi:hypothetical protein
MDTGRQNFGILLSQHALRRLRQRGLTQQQVVHVIDHGKVFHAGEGCMAYLSRGNRTRGQQPVRSAAPVPSGIAVVVGSSGLVVTVEHIHHRIPRHWRPATRGGRHER